MPEKEWAGNTFGTAFMHRWLVRILRHSDVRIWYVFADIFVLPFCMLLSHGARTARHYFRRRCGYGRWKSLWMTYLNHMLFAQVVIDKFALYAGKRMKLDVVNGDTFRRLASRKEGFAILSAHIGNYEMAGYELLSDKKPFNALVYGQEKATVMQGRQNLFSGNNIRMIPIQSDMSHLFRMEQALAAGEIVSIPGDRVFGSPRTVSISLLGSTAEIPAGPFSVAAMRGLDVIAVNVMKTSMRGYTAYVTPLHYDKDQKRRTQIQQLADGYAAELEHMLRMYPAQWYNYFEFWK